MVSYLYSNFEHRSSILFLIGSNWKASDLLEQPHISRENPWIHIIGRRKHRLLHQTMCLAPPARIITTPLGGSCLLGFQSELQSTNHDAFHVGPRNPRADLVSRKLYNLHRLPTPQGGNNIPDNTLQSSLFHEIQRS